MNNVIAKKSLVVTGILFGLTGAAFVAGVAVAKSAPKPPVLSPLSEAKWTPMMKDGPSVAPIQGDATKGAYMAYLKLPAGLVSPPHAHSSDYWAVMVQGKMSHWAIDGGSEAEAKQLGVGDLTFMPGKTEHVSKCFPGTDCICVIMQKGKSDFIPAKEPKGDKASAKSAAAPGAPAAPTAPAAPAAPTAPKPTK